MLDFMNPAGAGRRLVGSGWEAGFDEAGTRRRRSYALHNGQKSNGSRHVIRPRKEAAPPHNTTAMINLGLLYANGWGVEQDYVKAREWYEKAVDKGSRSLSEDRLNISPWPGEIYGCLKFGSSKTC